MWSCARYGSVQLNPNYNANEYNNKENIEFSEMLSTFVAQFWIDVTEPGGDNLQLDIIQCDPNPSTVIYISISKSFYAFISFYE